MITFKQFLSEARLAPLYHGTSGLKAIAILESDYMKRGSYAEPGIQKRTVSLTRNFTFARNWLNEHGTESNGAIFEIDQQKLAQRYKIVPYSYFGTRDIGYLKNSRLHPTAKTYSKGKDYVFENQYEEAVLSDIPKFTKYVTKVWIAEETNPEVRSICDRLNIPVKLLPRNNKYH